MAYFPGTSDDDVLVGEEDADLLEGYEGNDLLIGGGGTDTLEGGDGDDYLVGGADADVMLGGAGNDAIASTDSDLLLDGGAGTDELILDRSWLTSGITLSLADAAQGSTQYLPDGTLVVNFESIQFIGGSGDDQVTGGAGLFGNSYDGRAGNDTLIGADETPELFTGGAGDDVIVGGTSGGNYTDFATRDTVNFSGGMADYAIVYTGVDSAVVTDLREGSPDGTDTLSGVELLLFADGGAMWVNQAPTDITLDQHGVAENAADGTIVGTAVAVDVNPGDSNRFILLDDAGGRFGIDFFTGEVSVVDGRLLDAEAADSYTITVQLIDSAGISQISKELTIDVLDVNEAPAIVSNGGGDSMGVSVNEYETAVSVVAAEDPDQGAAIVYSIAGGEDAALFRIDAATGALRFAQAPEFAAPADGNGDNVYDVIVRASDGTLSDTQALAVSVLDVDAIAGTLNDDLLIGTPNQDQLVGLGGNDTLVGLQGADVLNGGEGNDAVDYSASTSRVVIDLYLGSATAGDAAGDTLISIENVRGSAFDDWFYADNAANRIDGGGNLDSVFYGYSPSGVQVSLASGIGKGGSAEGDRLTRIENLYGSRWDDLLRGDDGGNYLSGERGHDTLIGGAGNDLLTDFAGNNVLLGGDGNDTLQELNNRGNSSLSGGRGNDQLGAGLGTDTLDGGSGNDTLIASDSVDTGDLMIGGSGRDTADFSNSFYLIAPVTVDLAAGTGYAFTSTVQATWTFAGIENLIGSGFGDLLKGDAYANYIRGLAFADTIEGGAGRDTLAGDSGVDHLAGGTGDDTYIIDEGPLAVVTGDVLVEAPGEGNDSVLASVSFDLGNVAYLENLELTGTIATQALGNARHNVLTGNGASNIISGLAGNDTMSGGAGGQDTFTGGGGADVFVFDGRENSIVSRIDLVSDFVQGSDMIDLRQIDANNLLDGDQAFVFIGAQAFNHVAGELQYEIDPISDTTRLNMDFDGDALADYTILLTGQIAVTEADFLHEFDQISDTTRLIMDFDGDAVANYTSVHIGQIAVTETHFVF